MPNVPIIPAAPDIPIHYRSPDHVLCCVSLSVSALGHKLIGDTAQWEKIMLFFSMFDSQISRVQWIKRGVSACAIILAIAVYSLAEGGLK